MQFQVVPQELRAIAGAFRTAADEVHNMLGPTGTTANQTAAVMGQPEAADAMLELWARWSRQLDSLAIQLTDIASDAVRTADMYEDVDVTAVPEELPPGP
jgi:WXG100 family type VII secretion target